MITANATFPAVEQVHADPEDRRKFFEGDQELERFFTKLPPTGALSPREAELRWLAAHPEVLKEHAGQWIALEGPALIAADERLANVLAAARAQGIKRPLTMFIPVDPRDYLLGLSNQPIR